MSEELIVEITSGKIQGYQNRGVIKFKGIPYASAPVGKLRFAPPADVKPWDHVKKTVQYGPIAPQPDSALDAMFGEGLPQGEENCLTLNIWTQSIDGNKRPVMFWIHGGGFVTGSGAALDGSRLVLRGDVVVVSINYRLGPLGFLYVPNVTANAGILDMVKALEWTKDNISRFGGDPNNVTIFGESAGGFAVSTLLAFPSAKGLFHKAIIQSGGAHPFRYRPKEGTYYFEALVEQLKLEEPLLEKLRKLPYEELIKAHISITAISETDLTRTRAIRTGPVIDGEYLKIHPLEAIKDGYAKDISIFVGTNLDENTLFNMWNPKADQISEDNVRRGVERLLTAANKGEKKVEEMIDLYSNQNTSPRNIMDAISTDYMFRIPSIRIAEEQIKHQANTFMYLFGWKTPMQGGKLGATHALELPFVFGLMRDKEIGLWPKKTEETVALSEKMMDCWISFAKTGNPNHQNIPNLPPYDTDNRPTIIFDKEVTIQNDPNQEERSIWDDIM
jgi:para-nitrobenzyl esterase